MITTMGEKDFYFYTEALTWPFIAFVITQWLDSHKCSFVCCRRHYSKHDSIFVFTVYFIQAQVC